jgi:hypothetical protein
VARVKKIEQMRASTPSRRMLDDAGVRGRGFSRSAIVLATMLALAAPARAETIVVGPADGTCPGAIFSRIQSALDAAVPGSSIFVCAGVYAEQLLVTKRVKLLAAPGVRLVPGRLAVFTTSPSSGRPVAAAVTVRAPATIDGFAIDAGAHGITACDGTEPLLAGVYVRGVATAVLGTGVTGTRIPDATSTCANGVAILVDGGGSARIRLEGNSLDGYQQAGIIVQGAGARATVRENFVQGDGGTAPYAQTGIVIANGAAARVEDNVVRSHAGVGATGCAVDTGILLAAARTRVSGNQLEANAVGMRADSRGHFIRDNVVDGGSVGLVGLDLVADESRVTANTFRNQAVAGIRVTGNRNRVRANALSRVHEVPRCAALRNDAACAGLSARCGAGVWLLGRANLLAASAMSDVDVTVIDDGRGNVVR